VLSNRLKRALSRVRVFFIPQESCETCGDTFQIGTDCSFCIEMEAEGHRLNQEYYAELWHDKWMNNL
jgi:hypothetical protein